MTAAQLSPSMNYVDRALALTEAGLVPDAVIRAGIRRLNRRRLATCQAGDLGQARIALNNFVERMNASPVALVPHLANDQHYEVPAEFFHLVLGPLAKYSCCYWDSQKNDLEQAEQDALSITCNRAGIVDGMDILDLGCGWGSLSLWIARHFPCSRVTAVSNSRSQRKHIEAQANRQGLTNLRVITSDMNDFDIDQRFDRVVSVEMFEHMRNYGELFRRISGWLMEDGKFFMHIFSHKLVAYEFKNDGPSDWMSRHFFSGGIMPSSDLPLRFQKDLRIERQWAWDGRHYEATANSWLDNLDARRQAVKPIFEKTYGADRADQWIQRWRIFFMACAELFGTNNGQEWFVSHYLFSRP